MRCFSSVASVKNTAKSGRRYKNYFRKRFESKKSRKKNVVQRFTSSEATNDNERFGSFCKNATQQTASHSIRFETNRMRTRCERLPTSGSRISGSKRARSGSIIASVRQQRSSRTRTFTNTDRNHSSIARSIASRRDTTKRVPGQSAPRCVSA